MNYRDYEIFYEQTVKLKNFDGFAQWFDSAYHIVIDNGKIKDALLNEVSSYTLI